MFWLFPRDNYHLGLVHENYFKMKIVYAYFCVTVAPTVAKLKDLASLDGLYDTLDKDKDRDKLDFDFKFLIRLREYREIRPERNIRISGQPEKKPSSKLFHVAVSLTAVLLPRQSEHARIYPAVESSGQYRCSIRRISFF